MRVVAEENRSWKLLEGRVTRFLSGARGATGIPAIALLALFSTAGMAAGYDVTPHAVPLDMSRVRDVLDRVNPDQVAPDDVCRFNTGEKFRSVSKRRGKPVALTPHVVRLADCPSPDAKPSLDGLAESRVLDWWVIHTPDEDVARISAIASQNRAVLAAALRSANSINRQSVVNFLKADLYAVLGMVTDTCSLRFRINKQQSIGLTVFSDMDAGTDFCEGLAVALAVHGITLRIEGGAILVSIPD